MKLEEVQKIVDSINGTKVDSFSGLVAKLSCIPGIRTIEIPGTMADELDYERFGLMAILAALFDAGEYAGPQSITLETRHFKNYNEEFDYEVGFRLGNKWARLGHGFYQDIVRGINAKTRSVKPVRKTIPTMIIITPIS